MKKIVLLLMLLLVLANLPTLTKVCAQTTSTIKVEPEINVCSPYAVWPNYVNRTFQVNVTINNVASEEKLVAVEFYLTYNNTLLEFISVTEGPFLQDSRWNMYGIFFMSYTDELLDGTFAVKVGVVISPDQTNYSKTYDDWIMFPHGSGVIATITFKSIYQPVAPQPSESCILGLTETLLLGWTTGLDYYYISHDVEDGMYEVMPLQLPRTPIDVIIDVSAIYFEGEIAEFYILTSDYGKAVDVTNIKAHLYYNKILFANLTDAIEYVTTGLYMVAYTVPSGVEPGTYTLLVDAEFFEAKGTNIKSFLVSPTLTQWNTKLVAINGTVATIETDVGIIQTSIDEIHLKVVDIDWETKIANIQTDLGTVIGYVKDVDDGGLATISTPIGTIREDVSTLLDRVPEEPPIIDLTPVWIAVIFSILAFLTAILILLRKK